MLTPSDLPQGSALLRNLDEVLAYRVPELERKLLGLGLVEHAERAAELFQEVKKYLVLADSERELTLPMFSARVDETWHQFALFTREYIDFCTRFAGTYLHHQPSASNERSDARRSATFSDFQRVYERTFGSLPAAWFDELHLLPHTRLRCDRRLGPLRVECDAVRAHLVVDDVKSSVLCSTGRDGLAALRFIAEHPTFLLRELPGLRDTDRVRLCQPLVQFRILHVAP
jgi:hypothetical protein